MKYMYKYMPVFICIQLNGIYYKVFLYCHCGTVSLCYWLIYIHNHTCIYIIDNGEIKEYLVQYTNTIYNEY